MVYVYISVTKFQNQYHPDIEYNIHHQAHVMNNRRRIVTDINVASVMSFVIHRTQYNIVFSYVDYVYDLSTAISERCHYSCVMQ